MCYNNTMKNDTHIDHSDLSACCTAPVDTDYGLCSACYEHCELLPPYEPKTEQ